MSDINWKEFAEDYKSGFNVILFPVNLTAQHKEIFLFCVFDVNMLVLCLPDGVFFLLAQNLRKGVVDWNFSPSIASIRQVGGSMMCVMSVGQACASDSKANGSNPTLSRIVYDGICEV